MKKRVWGGIGAAAIAALLYFGWPIYGFVSHQFGVARTPWGWSEIPETRAGEQRVFDPAYAEVAGPALAALERRREAIGAPSLSAAVAVSDTIVWQGATGWADVEEQIQATPETAYRTGSTSKAVTATLFARLVDHSIVDPEAPVSLYLSDPPNPDWADITLRQLASHTAGITGYEENRDWVGLYRSMALQTRFGTLRSSLSVFDDSPLLFEPGTGYHYSSYDIVLLSAVLEAAAERPYLAMIEEDVAGPLHIGVIGADGLLPHRGPLATFYDSRDGKVRPWREVDLSHKLAGGGFIATPAQLARIGSAWLDDGFILPATREMFWTPVRLADDRVNEEDYAMGWRRKTWDIPGIGAVEHLNHGGISKGSQCWLMVVPRKQLSLAACTNVLTDEFFDFADVSRDLLQLFLSRAVKGV